MKNYKTLGMGLSVPASLIILSFAFFASQCGRVKSDIANSGEVDQVSYTNKNCPATAAALVASKINKNVVDYMVFCHQSDEQGHRLMLKEMQATPLLSLDLRLGEGTGAALALPLLRATASFYNDMASFESAGVDAV